LKFQKKKSTINSHATSKQHEMKQQKKKFAKNAKSAKSLKVVMAMSLNMSTSIEQ
jgi:hypothetical protein